MNNELRQEIREYVSQLNQSPRPPPQANRVSVSAQDLIERTRSIMQSAASSSSTKHTPNHPNRVAGKKRKLVKITTHELQVLHPRDDNLNETEHSVSDSDICIKEALINSKHNE